MARPGLDVHSSLSSLIAGLAGSKSLHWDQGHCLLHVSLPRCTIAQQRQWQSGAEESPAVVERRWMSFMFREHVVWLRADHIKHCGLRKPPVEKQDASSVQSGTDLVMLLFCRATQPRGTRLSVSWDKQGSQRHHGYTKRLIQRKRTGSTTTKKTNKKKAPHKQYLSQMSEYVNAGNLKMLLFESWLQNL